MKEKTEVYLNTKANLSQGQEDKDLDIIIFDEIEEEEEETITLSKNEDGIWEIADKE